MKILLSILVLIFNLQSFVKADDISEFEIEGMSIGDSLLDYFSEEDIIRWLSYPFWIWAVEIAVGLPTKRRLWNYSDIKYNWKGVISIKHFPAWVAFGILIEKLRLYTDPILM